MAPESTGLGLSKPILNRLEVLNIPFQHCREQAGKVQASVQARLLAENPRAFYVPCGAHTLNLMVSDAAKASMDATCFFWKCGKTFRFSSKMRHLEEAFGHHTKVLE